ncbi:GNAT family N-acetyltransferase [Acidaminobacter sp. JC074]|uniref:GNAT family N-acetyltransferase n=1 Tax=Acidaminobacter sp. JC074 TaxID=2530199 RepID=UPI001F0E3481|nr:GNAT family protein [Acidaminobacter sp. JC074]MCH4891357.1 GNAT family N-acetyltransferase [Acidaminobacter sp. JC074]
MKIINDELTIRSATKADADLLCTWWADGKVMAHAGFPNGLKTDKSKLESQLMKQSQMSQRMILDYKNESIGEMSYRLEEGVAEIGIKISNFDYQNRGLGKVYLSMLIDYLFKEIKVEKIILDTNLDNKRAQHVYEELGFKKVAVNVDAWKDQLGKLQSSVDYELKRSMYETLSCE